MSKVEDLQRKREEEKSKNTCKRTTSMHNLTHDVSILKIYIIWPKVCGQLTMHSFVHSFIHHVTHSFSWVADRGVLEPFPVLFGWKAANALDRSAVHHRADTQVCTFAYTH